MILLNLIAVVVKYDTINYKGYPVLCVVCSSTICGIFKFYKSIKASVCFVHFLRSKKIDAGHVIGFFCFSFKCLHNSYLLFTLTVLNLP